MIELLRVSKVFNQGRHNEYAAVREVSAVIATGRVTVIKGPSGSGKTTLLSLAGCMARPTSGRIWLREMRLPAGLGDGREVELSSLPERFLTGIRRGMFGVIFQQFNLIKGISALENVLLPAYPLGGDMAGLRRRGAGLLASLGMERQAASRVEWLSGGEAQRVAIARALINDPQVIMADEPTAHLDTALSREFMETVGRFRDEGRSVVIASHDPIVCGSPYVDSLIEMRDGDLTGQSAPTPPAP
ncbi:MAG: ABC transporter ATP-binding protein [Deltaproteobacteria bacterium]|nr:ABC transporter ATP-binding protein [Deltaproteobacteria bacterium]